MRSKSYEVQVGNIGSVHAGTTLKEARRVFNVYVEQSRSERGRAGGESVQLLRITGSDVEIFEEYVGRIQQEMRDSEEDL